MRLIEEADMLDEADDHIEADNKRFAAKVAIDNAIRLLNQRTQQPQQLNDTAYMPQTAKTNPNPAVIASVGGGSNGQG